MPFSKSFVGAVAITLFFNLTVSTSRAAIQAFPAISSYFTENHPNLPPLDSGIFFSDPTGTGFAIIGNSQRIVQNGMYGIPSLSRFNDTGDQLWSVFMDAGLFATDEELAPVPTDTGKFFAGYVEDGGYARMSIHNGGTLSADWAHRIGLVASPDEANLTLFPGQLSSLVQNAGGFIQVLVLNGSGNRVFEKRYASTAFGGIGIPSLTSAIPGLSFQTAKLSQIPDESGFYLSVHKSALDFSMPLNPGYNNTFFLLALNNSGVLQWSKSFDLRTRTPTTDESVPGPNNGYIYRVVDVNADVSSMTSTTLTHVVSIASNGSLTFAKTVDNIRLAGQFPTPDESSVFFSGAKTDPSSFIESDLGIVKLSATTGALLAQVAINIDTNDLGTIGGGTDDKIFGSVLSTEGFDITNPTATLFRFDGNLQNPLAVTYNENDPLSAITVRADNEISFSTLDEATGTLGAFTMDNNLSLLASGCDILSPATLPTYNPQLNSVDLSLSLADPTINVTDQTSALNATTLPLTELNFIVEACGSDGFNFIITISLTSSGEIKLEFPTREDKIYEILFTTDVATPFDTLLDTVDGDGNEACWIDPAPLGSKGFYRVLELDAF